jgi:GTP cyclohydrolase II
MEMIQAEGAGVIAYLYQEGRGHGLAAKIRAMRTENDRDCDTVDAFQMLNMELDPRSYLSAVEALRAHAVSKTIRLMTNNPRKAEALENSGFVIAATVPLQYRVNEHVRKYLMTKRNKLGHIIDDSILSATLI